MAENKMIESLPEVRAAVAALSPEDKKLLKAVQESPFRLTTPEQFREFAENVDYFVLEPGIRRLDDLGWSYLEQHMDIPLPPALREAIDPVPFGRQAMEEDRGCFTSRGYLSLSGSFRPLAGISCVCKTAQLEPVGLGLVLTGSLYHTPLQPASGSWK